MKRTEPYSSEEQREIAESALRGNVPRCPLCTSLMDEWPVPPRRDVSYVRDRVWLVCGRCSRSVVIDREGRGA